MKILQYTYDSYFAKTNKKRTITTKGFEIPRTNNKQTVGHFKRFKVLFIKKQVWYIKISL